MQEITTTDLGEFGHREWLLARDLLDAMIDDGLPEEFENDGVHLMFNRNSGHVFLTNSEYQVAMMNGDKLESFYSCPECGHEGFKDEIGKDNGHGYDEDCKEWVESVGGAA